MQDPLPAHHLIATPGQVRHAQPNLELEVFVRLFLCSCLLCSEICRKSWMFVLSLAFDPRLAIDEAVLHWKGRKNEENLPASLGLYPWISLWRWHLAVFGQYQRKEYCEPIHSCVAIRLCVYWIPRCLFMTFVLAHHYRMFGPFFWISRHVCFISRMPRSSIET